jgi:hypothetical protein
MNLIKLLIMKVRRKCSHLIERIIYKMLLELLLIKIKDTMIYYLKIEIKCWGKLFKVKLKIRNKLLHHQVF